VRLYVNGGIFNGSKTFDSFARETIVGYGFGSATGQFKGAVGTHFIGENLLNRGVAHGYSEFIFQVPNYSFQSYVGK
jgi:hypothetical protein